MDFALAHFCNRLGAPWIDPVTDVACAIWFLGSVWLVVLALVWTLDRPNARRVTATILVAVAIEALMTEVVLKHGLAALHAARIRPWLAHPSDIVPVGVRYRDSSFPSGHAANTASIVSVLSWTYRRALVPSIALVVAMAFARVHDGMHYPTDVLAGSVLGVAYAAAAIALVRRWWPRAAAPAT